MDVLLSRWSVDLARTSMNTIRHAHERSPSIETPEGWLTLGAGLAVASPHDRVLVMNRSPGTIPVGFVGHTSTNGST
jgi:hypothetical protein